MRICMITPDVTIDRRILQEARTLMAQGHEVALVAAAATGAGDEEYQDGIRILRLRSELPGARIRRRVKSVALGEEPLAVSGGSVQSSSGRTQHQRLGLKGVAYFLWVSLAFTWQAYRLACSERADVYQAHDLTALPAAYMAARRFGTPLVYDSHELMLESGLYARIRGWQKRGYAWLERFLMKRSAATITVNESIADEFVQRYGVPRPVVIMNCHDLTPPPAKTDRLRVKAGVPDGARIVLFQGGLSEGRGLPELVESSRLWNNAALVVMGEGELRPALEAQVREAGLHERVRFIGLAPVDDIISYSSGADLGVIPFHADCLNNYYATPNKMFEYLMAGLPIASSNLPELAKVVLGHSIGDVFDPADPQDMARAINSILDSPDRPAMALRARAIADERYNWEAESRKLVAIYESLSCRTAAPVRG